MAKRTIVVLMDDLDGSEAEESVRFELDGVSYELDLNATHAEELRTTLKPYIAAARVATRSRPPRSGRSRNRHIRQWAQQNGIPVPSRGIISARILEQYNAAH